MPSRNQIKDYIPDAYYHIYNRGVGKMKIFHDPQDYSVFLYYLRIVFSPIETLQKELQSLETKDSPSTALKARVKRLRHAIYKSAKEETFKNVKLLSFSLMPNHFHLLVYQTVKSGIEQVMRRIGTGYSMFYKNKYNWVGPIMQGRYSASHLSYDPRLQVIAAACYIERNPSNLSKDSPSTALQNYPYSSLKFYYQQLKQGRQPPVWLDTNHLLNIFNAIKENPNSVLEEIIAGYENFVDFVVSSEELDLEDVRLMYLNEG